MASLLVLALVSGFFHHYRFTHALPENHIHNFVLGDADVRPVEVTLRARVVSPGVTNQVEKRFPYQSKASLRTRVLLEVEQLSRGTQAMEVCGLVELSIPQLVDCFRPGQEVTVAGQLAPTLNGPGRPPFTDDFHYYHGNRIFARIFAFSMDDVKINADSSISLRGLLHTFRCRARALLAFDAITAESHATGLLTATILGDRYRLQNDLSQAMVRIGAAHYLAVSGFNLAVLAWSLWALGTLAGLGEKWRTILVIACASLFTALTDFQPSVLRAWLMILLVCGGSLLNRPVHTVNSLSVAALLLLLANPNQLFDAGFQLSFVACLSLVVLSNPLSQILFHRDYPPPSDSRLESSGRVLLRLSGQQLRGLFASSLAAGVGTLPLVAFHFGLLSIIGPVSTVILFPFASLLTLVGFLQMALGLFIPTIGHLLGYVSNALAALTGTLSILLAKIPGTCLDVPPPAWYLIVAYLAVVFSSLAAASARRFRYSWRLPAVGLLAAVYLSMWVWPAAMHRPCVYIAGDYEGQCTTVVSGRSMIYFDCGAREVGRVGEFTRRAVSYFLAAPRAVFLTAPDQKCFNDLWSLTELNPRLQVFLPPNFTGELAKSYPPVRELLDDPALRKLFPAAGHVITDNDASITVLSPSTDAQGDTAYLLQIADYRLIVASRISYPTARAIARSYPHLRANAVILSAEGLTAATFESLLAQAHPQKIIVTGKLSDARRQVYRDLAKKYRAEFLEPAHLGGYLLKM